MFQYFVKCKLVTNKWNFPNPIPANSQYPVFYSFHWYGHRYGPLVEMVSIRGTHVPCRWGRKRESPREGAFALGERSSSGAIGSRLSLFSGSSQERPGSAICVIENVIFN
jgi:hypothetical protein